MEPLAVCVSNETSVTMVAIGDCLDAWRCQNHTIWLRIWHASRLRARLVDVKSVPWGQFNSNDRTWTG